MKVPRCHLTTWLTPQTINFIINRIVSFLPLSTPSGEFDENNVQNYTALKSKLLWIKFNCFSIVPEKDSFLLVIRRRKCVLCY